MFLLIFLNCTASLVVATKKYSHPALIKDGTTFSAPKPYASALTVAAIIHRSPTFFFILF